MKPMPSETLPATIGIPFGELVSKTSVESTEWRRVRWLASRSLLRGSHMARAWRLLLWWQGSGEHKVLSENWSKHLKSMRCCWMYFWRTYCSTVVYIGVCTSCWMYRSTMFYDMLLNCILLIRQPRTYDLKSWLHYIKNPERSHQTN